MEPQPVEGITKWQLTAEAFNKLLSLLAPEQETAGLKYVELREQLIRRFEWQHPANAIELADETLNRVCRKAEEGEAILDVQKYAFGIARFVGLEDIRQPREYELDDEFLRTLVGMEPVDEDDEDILLKCLKECLAKLSPEEREQVLEYHAKEKRAKIEERERMAERLGIRGDALRQRMSRLKRDLEKCTLACKKKTLS